MIESKRVKVAEVPGETERYLDATLYRNTETGAERLVLDPLPELPELKPLPKDDSLPPTN